MNIEEKVYALLSAAPSVTAIVPSSKIKPLGNWQNLERPYIVQFPVARGTNYTHSGLQYLNRWPYQISCFADMYSQCRELSIAVIDSLTGNQDGVQFFCRNQTAIYDMDVNVHQIAIDFEIFETLTNPATAGAMSAHHL